MKPRLQLVKMPEPAYRQPVWDRVWFAVLLLLALAGLAGLIVEVLP